MRYERAPTFARAARGYSLRMNDGIYFADAELPFHVWVRERTGASGYKWVLRDAKPAAEEPAPAVSDSKPSAGALPPAG